MKNLCFFFLMLSPLCRLKAQNDTAFIYQLQNVNITDNRVWKNDTARYRYNQMKYYVTTILPYLNAATILFDEINAKLNDPTIAKKERKKFIKEKEAEMKLRFEDRIEKLNSTQGALLMKLIARQTGVNIYQMLGDFKNPFVAIKWQTWARLNGFNLNKKYQPQEEPDLEHIMESLGYPLPAMYAARLPQ